MSAAVAVPAQAAPSCPACSGAATLLSAGIPGAEQEPYRIARMSYGTPYPVHRCSACGLGWVRVPFGAPEVIGAYETAVEPLYGDEESARRKTFRRGLERVRRHAPGLRLLDVGASTGLLLAEARELGFEVSGVEPSRWAALEAQTRFGFDLIPGDLLTAALPDGAFDAVTLVDVIEHLVDPFAALARVHRALADKGVLYLVTPDLGSLPARLLGARWWGFEPWHLWYFSRESLVLTLERQGFEVIERRSYRRTFSLGYWLAKGEGLVGRTLARGLSRLAGAMRLEGVKLTLDLRDTHEVLARKR